MPSPEQMAKWRKRSEEICEEQRKLMQAKTTEALRTRYQLLEELAAAYCQKVGLPPEEVCLCEQMGKDGVMRWWFERKKP